MSEFLNALKKRRSIYALGNNLTQTTAEITELVKEIVRESPSAFNSQTQRVVILTGESYQKLWQLTTNLLEPLTPPDAFAGTKQKLASFAAGKGTILFFEDTDIVKSLQEQFPLYAANFPVWSEQASGLTQVNVWTALAEKNIGANLQHYNPVIDEAVTQEWNLPKQWKLRAQLNFGSIEAPAGEKEYMENDARFLEFN